MSILLLFKVASSPTPPLPDNRLITSDGDNFMTSAGEYFIVQEA